MTAHNITNVPTRFRPAAVRALQKPERPFRYGSWHVVASADNSDDVMRVHIWVGNDGPTPTHIFDTPELADEEESK